MQFSGSTSARVIDGPFTETKELIAGFWILQVKSKEEAIEWVKRCPNPMPGSDSENRDPSGLRSPRTSPTRRPRIIAQEEALRKAAASKSHEH